MANQNAKRSIVQEQYYNLLNQMAESGDKTGINKILSSPSFQKLRMAAGLGKGAAVLGAGQLGGIGGDVLSQLTQGTAGVMLGLGAPQSGKNTAKMQSQAYQRNLNAMAGAGTGFGDIKAATGNTASNVMQLGKTGFYASSLAGMSNPALAGFMGPGMMASQLSGGITGLGATTAGGLSSVAGTLGLGSGATSALAAANPMMMGVMAMMAATKGGKALYNYTQKDSSTNVTIDRRSMITRGTSPHQLEQDYGNTNTLRMQIGRLQNMGQLKPGESLIANILAMIEGHTSVLPYIAAEAVDSESRKNKEGGFAGHNILNDMFGDNGDIQAAGSSDTKIGILSRIFNGLELGSSNMLSTFDPGTYLSAILQGKSVTEMYNTANSKQKGVDALKSEEQFAARTGTSTSLVQAIHTTPSQIMDKADTFEAKQLSVLGLISEINRFSAHELLKIRMDGFGISNSSTHGLLSQIREQNEVNSLADQSFYDIYLKSADELMGYLPGWNMISGSMKMASSGSEWMKDMFLGDKTGEFDENGKEIRKKNRGIGEVFTDWMASDLKNSVLESEEQLKAAVGAVEMGPQELMANYIGKAYPDRFELLLKYNLSQMESLQALAGPTKRSKFTALSMNKYDGTFADQDYHNKKNKKIRKNMKREMNFLNDSGSQWGQWYKQLNEDDLIASQLSDASESNSFLRDFLDSNGKNIKSNKGNKASRKQLSAEDLQNAQKAEELDEHKISLAEQQVNLLQDIRDCLNCKGEDYKLRNKKFRENSDNNNSDTNLGWLDLGGDNKGGKNSKGKGGKNSKGKGGKTPKPKMGTLTKIKEFFSLKSLKGLMTKGTLFTGIASLVSRIPMIGGLLANPVVLTAIGVAAAGYGLYELGSWAYDKVFGIDRDKQDNITSKMTNAQQLIGKNLLSEYEKKVDNFDDDIVKMSSKLDSKSDNHLKYMYKMHSGDNAIMAAIEHQMKKRSMKTNKINGDGISEGLWFSGRSDNTFKKGQVDKIKQYDLDTTRRYLSEYKDVMSDDMRKQLSNIIQDKESSSVNNWMSSGKGLGTNSGYMKERLLKDATGGVISNGKHKGMDWKAPVGTPIYSISPGTVETYQTKGRGGNVLIVKDPKGKRVIYMHLSKFIAKEGSTVERGTLLALSGNSGSSTGPHIHISVKAPGGQHLNPEDYILEARNLETPDDSYDDVEVSDPSATYAQEQSEAQEKEAASALKTKIESARNGYNAHSRQVMNDGKVDRGDLGNLITQQNLLQQQINVAQNDENKKLLQHQLSMLGLIVDTLKQDKVKVLSLNKHVNDVYDDLLFQ